MAPEQPSNQAEENLNIPSKELNRLSEKARQLIELLAYGEQINSRVLWTALGLANEREPFIALCRICDEINNKLSAYGEVYEALAVHGRPFAWKQAESVSLEHKMDAAIRELGEVVQLAGQSNDSETILRKVAGEIEKLTTAIQARLRGIENIETEKDAFISAVSLQTAKRWEQSYRRKPTLDIDETTRNLVTKLVEEFLSEEYGSRSHDDLAEAAGIANGRQVAMCLEHLIQVLETSEHTLHGQRIEFAYSDNRLHIKRRGKDINS